MISRRSTPTIAISHQETRGASRTVVLFLHRVGFFPDEFGTNFSAASFSRRADRINPKFRSTRNGKMNLERGKSHTAEYFNYVFRLYGKFGN